MSRRRLHAGEPLRVREVNLHGASSPQRAGAGAELAFVPVYPASAGPLVKAAIMQADAEMPDVLAIERRLVSNGYEEGETIFVTDDLSWRVYVLKQDNRPFAGYNFP